MKQFCKLQTDHNGCLRTFRPWGPRRWVRATRECIRPIYSKRDGPTSWSCNTGSFWNTCFAHAHMMTLIITFERKRRVTIFRRRNVRVRELKLSEWSPRPRHGWIFRTNRSRLELVRALRIVCVLHQRARRWALHFLSWTQRKCLNARLLMLKKS